jgi:single-strand selective monofunctional uracil DNA glycosylase
MEKAPAPACAPAREPRGVAARLIAAADDLRRDVAALTFSAPVAHVYSPLDYAWEPHICYLNVWADSTRRVVFLGMNPGPWGMAQVGVPFGEVSLVRDWLGVSGTVRAPQGVHPSRPVAGFACRRSEVSGRRLWGLFAARYGSPEAFFRDHFVANYCPLMFLEASGRNLTPDKLRPAERELLLAVCDRHLQRLVDVMEPDWVIGVGTFAAGRAAVALRGRGVRVESILHPSPASPAANRGWGAAVEERLQRLGLWAPATT